jgi:hypothetical protein
MHMRGGDIACHHISRRISGGNFEKRCIVCVMFPKKAVAEGLKESLQIERVGKAPFITLSVTNSREGLVI